MCGIAGLVAKRARPLGAILAMNDAQRHRGPDGEGYLVVDGERNKHCYGAGECPPEPVGQLAFGHLRLAILDPTPAGLQPFSTDGVDWLMHNGEIYNYRELRRELERAGHRFRTGTDTEVLLASYQEWGVDCFARFNGMWSAAIWDARRQRLVLSRDRFGIKPLHVAQCAEGLAFASEISGVLASGWLSAKLNRQSAVQFLRWANTNTSNETMFEGIEAFPPGHYAEIDIDHPTSYRPIPFYDLAEAVAAIDGEGTDAEAGFRDLLTSSVQLRMRSDVPVGSCLSGGLDSSSIVAIAAGQAQGPLATFTSTFAQQEYDESSYANIVNDAVGADPKPVRPCPEGFMEELGSLIRHQEEPFGSTSIYAQWCLMKEARQQGIPVLLDGQGGDELLCGYRKYYMFHLQSLIRQRRLTTAAAEVVRLARHGDREQWQIISGGSRYLPDSLQRRLWSVQDALSPEFARSWNDAESNLGGLGGSDIRSRQVTDVTSLSVPSLLRYEDRNSMAWSVEARVPFLDHRLVEYSIALPIEAKLSGGTTKAVMRNSLRGVVPAAILDRKDKLGFTTPMADWLAGPLRSLVADRLRRPTFAGGLVDGAAIVDEFEARASQGDLDVMTKIFRLFMFDYWMDQLGVEP
ncbi:MAG: asparagine synthase (glutamine-hydrolyzing) [Acidimicrobiales bacterium]